MIFKDYSVSSVVEWITENGQKWREGDQWEATAVKQAENDSDLEEIFAFVRISWDNVIKC